MLVGGQSCGRPTKPPRATQESIQDAQHARPPHPPRIKGERCQRVVLILGGCGGRPCCVSWIDSWGARGACCALCRTLRGRSQDPPRSLPVVFPSAWNLSGRGPQTGFLHKKRKIQRTIVCRCFFRIFSHVFSHLKGAGPFFGNNDAFVSFFGNAYFSFPKKMS